VTIQASPQTAELEAWRRAHPELLAHAVQARRRAWAVALLFAIALALGFWWIDASPARIWRGLSRLGFLVTLMLPPSSGGALAELCYALVETLAMAFLGTLLAAIAAVPLGFLGARNVVANWLAHFSFRRGLDGLRAVDTLIWALIFVSAVGMGPFAGILAIACSDVALLTKLYAEAIENVDKKPIEAVRAAGGDRLQAMRLAVVPQILPVMLSHVLYFFESNMRSASVLGIVGAGGIGLQLSERIRVNNWDQALFIIMMMLATVALIDIASRRIRLAIINSQHPSSAQGVAGPRGATSDR
jgi:phosphonate transport system permease protein